MVALRTLREAVRALAEVPVVFVGGLIYALVVAPQDALALAGVSTLPTGLGVVTFFVTPFVVAGVIGMAAEALVEGRTDLSTLVSVGRDRYRALLIGSLLEFGLTVIALAIGLVTGLLLVFIPGASLLAATGTGALLTGTFGIGGLVVFGAAVLLLVLVVATLFFFIQFYAVAIVHNETNATDGFRQSYRLVRRNLRSALGFSLVNLLVSLLTSLPVVALISARLLRQFGDGGAVGAGSGSGTGSTSAQTAVAASELFSVPEILALTAVSTLLTTVLVAFRQTYATAFYRALSPRVV